MNHGGMEPIGRKKPQVFMKTTTTKPKPVTAAPSEGTCHMRNVFGDAFEGYLRATAGASQARAQESRGQVCRAHRGCQHHRGGRAGEAHRSADVGGGDVRPPLHPQHGEEVEEGRVHDGLDGGGEEHFEHPRDVPRQRRVGLCAVLALEYALVEEDGLRARGARRR